MKKHSLIFLIIISLLLSSCVKTRTSPNQVLVDLQYLLILDQVKPAFGDRFGRSTSVVVLQDQKNKVHISLFEVN